MKKKTVFILPALFILVISLSIISAGWIEVEKSATQSCPDESYISKWQNTEQDEYERWIVNEFYCQSVEKDERNRCEWEEVVGGGSITCGGDRFLTSWKDTTGSGAINEFECCEPESSVERNNCEWVEIVLGGTATCPSGKYAAGWKDTTGTWAINEFYCCDMNFAEAEEEKEEEEEELILCTDGDLGKDYSEKADVVLRREGTTLATLTDYCAGSTLYEYFCSSGDSSDSIAYTCPYGCDEGVCLEVAEEEEEEECEVVFQEIDNKTLITGTFAYSRDSTQSQDLFLYLLYGKDGEPFRVTGVTTKLGGDLAYITPAEDGADLELLEEETIKFSGSFEIRGDDSFVESLKNKIKTGEEVLIYFNTKYGWTRNGWFKSLCLTDCTDSDGGLDYYEKGEIFTLYDNNSDGYIIEGEGHAFDRCYVNNTKLIEYYCEDDYGISVGIDCLEGCEDGACIGEENVTEEVEEEINRTEIGCNTHITLTLEEGEELSEEYIRWGGRSYTLQFSDWKEDISAAHLLIYSGTNIFFNTYVTEDTEYFFSELNATFYVSDVVIAQEVNKIELFLSRSDCAENATGCTSNYECEFSPATCPFSGIQTKTCEDVKCDEDDIVEEVACEPGKCAGCVLSTQCVPYGVRTLVADIPSYCDVDKELKQQKSRLSDGSWASCQNNHECESNICSSGECIELTSMLEGVSAFKSLGVRLVCRIAHPISTDNFKDCIVGFLGEE